MPSAANTFYANTANVKITGNELVFEFGAVFAGANQSQTGKASEFVPEVRIVMALPALKAFADILQKAIPQMESATGAHQQPTPGNRPESKQ